MLKVIVGYLFKIRCYLIDPTWWVKDFLKTRLKHRFIRAELPPSSPDVNLLGYSYCDFVKTKVYEGRFGKQFTSASELKKKKYLWNICANDLVPIMKSIK